MKKIINPVLVLGAASALTACATVTRGTTETFTVETTPAAAKVALSNGQSCEATPCDFEVKRKEVFSATVTKAGFKPSTHEIATVAADGQRVRQVGNFLVGGIVALGVDARTGAGLDHTPNPLVVELEPAGEADIISELEAALTEESEAVLVEEEVEETTDDETAKAAESVVDESSEEAMTDLDETEEAGAADVSEEVSDSDAEAAAESKGSETAGAAEEAEAPSEE